MKSHSAKFVLPSAIIFLLAFPGLKSCRKESLIGRVIAKDAYLGLARINTPMSVQVFIVKVDNVSQGENSPRFIKIKYEDDEDKEALPSGLLDGESLWRFSISRDKSCDQTVSENLFIDPSASAKLPEAGAYILLRNAIQDIPAPHSLLPCFTLRPGGVKLIPRHK
jgi:hypothetical protein